MWNYYTDLVWNKIHVITKKKQTNNIDTLYISIEINLRI